MDSSFSRHSIAVFLFADVNVRFEILVRMVRNKAAVYEKLWSMETDKSQSVVPNTPAMNMDPLISEAPTIELAKIPKDILRFYM